jgi:hypothetical protein
MKLMGVVHPGLGLGEGGVELRVTIVRREMFALAEGEDRIFQRAGAVEAPAVPGDGLGEVGFEGAVGVEVFAEGIARSFLAHNAFAMR